MYKQLATLEEKETHINIVYADKCIYIYTNNATVMRRFEKKKITAHEIFYKDSEVYAITYKVDLKDVSKILRADLFKYNKD